MGTPIQSPEFGLSYRPMPECMCRKVKDMYMGPFRFLASIQWNEQNLQLHSTWVITLDRYFMCRNVRINVQKW